MSLPQKFSFVNKDGKTFLIKTENNVSEIIVEIYSEELFFEFIHQLYQHTINDTLSEQGVK